MPIGMPATLRTRFDGSEGKLKRCGRRRGHRRRRLLQLHPPAPGGQNKSGRPAARSIKATTEVWRQKIYFRLIRPRQAVAECAHPDRWLR